MKINKSLDIDLNIISPQKNIRIHEGDIDSIDIVLAVSADDVPLDLTGTTIKYDATINNYLVEQDADGSADDNKIIIPVTENMAAMPGLLLIDVRMIRDSEVLFTQTISAIVDKAVVNGSTYIDFSKITINQRLNALEEQMAYIEELVDGLDTSKQITSNRRPPQTAPATVDVDFFRVGDTWIYQGFNIVYKLVEVEYNYQPDPEVPAVHKFTWQTLNEYFSFGTSEPPTSAVYMPIEYVIGDLTFNALPVSEYSKGDTYAQIVSGEAQALYKLINKTEGSAGQYSYIWYDEEGGSGEGGTKTFVSQYLPPYTLEDVEFWEELHVGDRWIYTGYSVSGEKYGSCVYTIVGQVNNGGTLYPIWERDSNILVNGNSSPPIFTSVNYGENLGNGVPINWYRKGDFKLSYQPWSGEYQLHICRGYIDTNPQWDEIYFSSKINSLLLEKEDISNKVTTLSTDSTDDQYPSAKCVYDLIGDIGTALDTLNDNLAEV